MIKHHLLLTFLSITTPLISMQSAQQDLQKKIAAARIHNRSQCPLAKLPKDVQDMIAQYLEFNDRESDEEFVRNSQKITSIRYYKLQKHITIDKLLFEKLKPYESRIRFHLPTIPLIQIVYSRDKSKVLMTKNYDFSAVEKGCYFFVYDIRNHQITLSKFFLSQKPIIPIALSNDGKFILQKGQPAGGYNYQLFSIDKAKADLYSYNILKNFNKQSTKYIYRSPKYMNTESPEDLVQSSDQKYFTELLCSEQEHKERSKKTLALYLHQKGICKPFDYRQESA